MEVGERVEVQYTILDDDRLPVRPKATGMVIGHRGERPVVALDAGGYVEWKAEAFRPVRAVPSRRKA